MSNQDIYTLGFTIGYGGSAMLLIALITLVFMPFGYGYIGTELGTAYVAWTTAYNWDNVVAAYEANLPR